MFVFQSATPKSIYFLNEEESAETSWDEAEHWLSKLIINTDASFLISLLGRTLWLKSKRSVYKFAKVNSHSWKTWKGMTTSPEQQISVFNVFFSRILMVKHQSPVHDIKVLQLLLLQLILYYFLFSFLIKMLMKY